MAKSQLGAEETRERVSAPQPRPQQGPRMDIRREPASPTRRRLYLGGGIVAVLLVTATVLSLDPAAPSVNRNSLLIGEVDRGSFTREVRGPGTLVPEQMVFVTAMTGGRVEQVWAQPGQAVADTTLLLVLSNPDVQLEALRAEQELTSARARLVELGRDLQTLLLQQEALVARASADRSQARRVAEADSTLLARQLISVHEASRNREQLEALEVRLSTEKRRSALLESTVKEQLAVQKQQVERLASIVAYQQRRVGSMRITAGAAGVLQDLDLEIGQWVQAGTTLARVAQPGRLKAEIRIPQTQARDVQIGQSAIIDTRADSIEGLVRRVDPNVQNGSVLVEVRLEGTPPPGARPDLSVDGTIRIESIEDVLFLGRPVYGQAHSTVGLFKLTDSGDEAVRVTARLGRTSVNLVEVVDGLSEGDRIILSDMSRWDDVERVRID
ncbi:MAG: HlyD family efflux transporter periplasmic adaptor subunit [Gemmatimonadales bacterium]|jgi:HlyD family secretion protein